MEHINHTCGKCVIHLHSARLLEILVAKLPPGLAYFGKRLENFTIDHTKASEAITITFEDGTTATCDVLVGSDGVKSATRAKLFEGTGIDISPKYMGKN